MNRYVFVVGHWLLGQRKDAIRHLTLLIARTAHDPSGGEESRVLLRTSHRTGCGSIGKIISHHSVRTCASVFRAPRCADFGLRPAVERSAERNAESRIASGGLDRCAQNDS
jgi:hypothetical protein